jgi:hemoglobin
MRARSQLAPSPSSAWPVEPEGSTPWPVGYALNQWDALMRYTTDGRLSIDNNAAERALRGVAVGRKNWMFLQDETGGMTTAVVLSLLTTGTAGFLIPELATLDRVGRKAAIDAAIDVFYDKVLVDERIRHFFAGVDIKDQRARQKRFLAFAFGAPTPYAGRSLRDAHGKLVARGLNDSHFDAVAGHLAGTLAEIGVPADLAAEVMTIASRRTLRSRRSRVAGPLHRGRLASRSERTIEIQPSQHRVPRIRCPGAAVDALALDVDLELDAVHPAVLAAVPAFDAVWLDVRCQWRDRSAAGAGDADDRLVGLDVETHALTLLDSVIELVRHDPGEGQTQSLAGLRAGGLPLLAVPAAESALRKHVLDGLPGLLDVKGPRQVLEELGRFEAEKEMSPTNHVTLGFLGHGASGAGRGWSVGSSGGRGCTSEATVFPP